LKKPRARIRESGKVEESMKKGRKSNARGLQPGKKKPNDEPLKEIEEKKQSGRSIKEKQGRVLIQTKRGVLTREKGMEKGQKKIERNQVARYKSKTSRFIQSSLGGGQKSRGGEGTTRGQEKEKDPN